MEVLRIVAMLMIITLHYLDKGGVLKEFELKMGLNRNIAWIIEALCMGSVNVYVLISGYFLSKSEFKVKKVITLWAQIIFYSWVVEAVYLVVSGVIFNPIADFYKDIPIIMPVTCGHYWFATIYILLYLFFPFLNKGIGVMDKKQHRLAIAATLAVFSLWNTFLPFTIPLTDHEGMDICWFVCLYLVAAYLRKYPEDFKLNRWIYLLISFVSAISAFLLGKGIFILNRFVGKLGGYAKNFYPYNSIFIFIASVCLFIFVLKHETKTKAPRWLTNIVLFASTGTFGVYLLHEHLSIRYLWPRLLKVAEYSEKIWFLPHLIGTVLAIFIVGIIADFIRRKFFDLVVFGVKYQLKLVLGEKFVEKHIEKKSDKE